MRFSAVFVLAFICAATGLTVAWLKVDRLSVPLDPTAEATVWDVEARVAFEGRGQPAKVTLTLPDTPPGFALLDEDFVSRSFGLAIRAADAGRPRQAVWTVRRASGAQALYYHMKVYPKREEVAPDPGPAPTFPEVPEYAEPLRSAIEAVLAKTRAQSADINTFTGLLVADINKSDDENVKLIRKSATEETWAKMLTEVLAGARLGLKSHVYSPVAEDPAFDVCAAHTRVCVRRPP